MLNPKLFFPRSEGFSFYFGGLGVETCSLDAATVRNRLQPFATVGNRWQPSASDYRGGKMAAPMANSVTVVRFQMSHSFVSRGRRGTL